MDQSLFALTNFLLNILLARWLEPVEYGGFVTAYTIFLLIGTIHTGILTEPMQVFGPGRQSGRFPNYLIEVLTCHAVFSIAMCAFVLLGSLAFWEMTRSQSAVGLMALAVAGPFILFQWLVRRACYAVLRPVVAAQAGVVYMFVMVVGIYGLYLGAQLTVPTVFGVMAFASMISGLWPIVRLGIGSRLYRFKLVDKSVVMEHWRYGRWAMVAGVLSWIPGNIVYLMLSLWHGLEAAGTLRALMNLIMPALHVSTAITGILLPALVHARIKGRNHFLKLLRVAATSLVVASLLYGMVVAPGAEPILRLMYDYRYVEYTMLVWPLALLPITTAWVAGMAMGLRALHAPRKVTQAFAISTLVALTGGVLLVEIWGIGGAVVTVVLCSICTACVLSAGMYVRIKGPLSDEK